MICLGRKPTMNQEIPRIRMHLWLETGQGLCFGLGRAMLLSKIQQHGSLKKAAEEMGMSYRAAWGKIKRSEEILGMKLIDQVGSKREGCQLTDSGRMLMERFLLWFEELELEALKKGRDLLPVPIQGYNEE